MDKYKLEALNIAKEITIAKLANSSPNSSGKEPGERIGEMLTSIYNATVAIMDDIKE